MHRGLICLLLLAMAAISVPAYAMTVINTGQNAAWLGTPTIALLATPNSGTVNEGFGAGSAQNGVVSTTFTVTAGNTKLDKIAIGIVGSGEASVPYTLRLVDLGVLSPIQQSPYAPGTDLWGGALTWTWSGNGSITDYEFDFQGAEELTLTVGHTYAFEITGGTAGLFYWRRLGNTYTGGAMYQATGLASNRVYIPAGPRTSAMAVYLVSLLPAQATNPSPANEATDVNLTPTFSWTAGARAASHHVYFGTTSPGTLQGDQTETTFNPGTLLANTAYYWRIDENNVNGTTTGDVWSFTTGNIYPLTITKCKVNAGKTQGADSGDITNVKDSIQLAGTAEFPADANQITQLDINIISVTDGEIIYHQTITGIDDYVNPLGKKISYTHKITKADPNGAVTLLKLDFVKDTFILDARNIDLTGLGSPVKLEFVMGDATVIGEADEAIVNGKKLIPTRLMRMYDDKIVVTKATAKHKSTKALSDSLTVTGEIAVEDINNIIEVNEPNLAVRDVNFVWGDQIFKVQAGDLVSAKTGHKYTCKKVQSDANEGEVTAKFDLDKCTFTVSVKKADNLNVLPDYPDVNFSINYGIGDANDFNETANVNLVTRRSY